MYPSITRVEYLDDYRLLLTFTSGESGVLDLAYLIIGSTGALTPLQEVRYFAQFKVDPASGKMVWPNGVAIAADVLYVETIQAETVQAAFLKSFSLFRQPRSGHKPPVKLIPFISTHFVGLD